ncbi:Phr family secreted Rap phosphatase inhibitor [Bacillus cereus]|uniref:Phr family secreted Rap phosphatase inhibitor n=1 Tax=Bacillus cereus TaxID=1396 RepID=UPI001F1B2E3B|nr:Phr family secreted Rap phosphatase inhibitor [Bacillus cereus]UIJ67378.1 Phr family secreted Rap phosphatase inhibitor [Bacillus cereus]
MKKIHFGMLGIALVGVLSIGANSSFTNQALNIGETGGAPADNRGDGGGISKQDSHADHF